MRTADNSFITIKDIFAAISAHERNTFPFLPPEDCSSKLRDSYRNAQIVWQGVQDSIDLDNPADIAFMSRPGMAGSLDAETAYMLLCQTIDRIISLTPARMQKDPEGEYKRLFSYVNLFETHIPTLAKCEGGRCARSLYGCLDYINQNILEVCCEARDAASYLQENILRYLRNEDPLPYRRFGLLLQKAG